MKIEFRKVAPQKKDFSIQIEDITFKGEFCKLSNSMVEVSMSFGGKILHQCDRCGDDFLLDVDEKSRLFVSDGEYKGEEIDVIESFDRFVDFDEICQSELEAFKSDYHYCKKCKEKDKEL